MPVAQGETPMPLYPHRALRAHSRRPEIGLPIRTQQKTLLWDVMAELKKFEAVEVRRRGGRLKGLDNLVSSFHHMSTSTSTHHHRRQ